MQAEALFKRKGARWGQAHVLLDMGKVGRSLDRIDQAHDFLFRELSLYSKQGQDLGRAQVFLCAWPALFQH